MRMLIAAALVAFSAPVFAADHAVEIKGMKFNPPTLDVAVGDTVTFTNNDGAPHTGTALDGSFDTGKLTKGQSGTVTIAAAGTHDYKCAIHTSMKGSVTAK